MNKVLTQSKSLIALMLVLILGASMVLTGCGSNDKPTSTGENPIESEQFEDALKEAAEKVGGDIDTESSDENTDALNDALL